MNERRLGRTGLSVSEIGYGAWGIGGTLWRGAEELKSISGEVGAAQAGDWGGDTNGNFGAKSGVTHLLDTCIEAAFAETLHVKAKATNGWDRIEAYDAWDVWSFALAPKMP